MLADLDPGRLPWVRYATPPVLSAGELERLRGPIVSAHLSLRVDEDDHDLPEPERLSPRLEAIDHRLIRASLDAQRASTVLDVPARFSCRTPTSFARSSARRPGGWMTTPAGEMPPRRATCWEASTSPRRLRSCAAG